MEDISTTAQAVPVLYGFHYDRKLLIKEDLYGEKKKGYGYGSANMFFRRSSSQTPEAEEKKQRVTEKVLNRW